MFKELGRRDFVASSGALLAVLPRFARPPRWSGKQFHNQPADSHQHRFLVDLWNAVKAETGGDLEIVVYPQNNNIPGSDPAALDMLKDGQLEFFTVMGGILARIVPAADVQGVPFAYTSHKQVHTANDGKLGEYVGKECEAKGIHRFRYGLLENGFRQISMLDKPVRTVDDLAGIKMRVPDAEIFRETFRTLGAMPVTVNISDLYEALKTHRVDGQENPLVVIEVNKLYEVTKYLSITNHMWSGFNLLANLRFWRGLPENVQAVVNRNVKTYVALQRAYTDDLNSKLTTSLAQRGMIVNVADSASFRRRLDGAFYERWRQQLGRTTWSLLENEVGKLVG
jgi:tripartite ATP-independent transporter DctP family solute receptor